MNMGKYKYMQNLYSELNPLFDGITCELFAFNTGDDVNSPDCEFIDGFHGSNKTYLYMLFKMANMDKSILSYLKDTLDLKKYILEYPDVNVKYSGQ